MMLFGRKLPLEYFIPPIIPMVLRKANQHHPFENLPKRMDVKWVLDVGANKGDIALAALKSYPGSKVICFEPVHSTFEMLKKNLAAYGDRTYLFEQALSDSNGEGEINLTSFHGANSVLPQSGFHKMLNPHIKESGKEKISLARLDDASFQFPTKEIDIMKIDVEGYELNVLRGGEAFIRDHVDTIIIEASFMRDQSWETQGAMQIFFELERLGFRLINIFDIYKSENTEMMLAQMDCVFRHKSKLSLDR